MPEKTMVSLRCPPEEREALERVRDDLARDLDGVRVTLSQALLYVLKQGIRAHRGR